MKKQDFNLSKRIIIGPGSPLRGGISESNQALHSYYQSNGLQSYIVSYSLQYPSFFFPGKTQIVDDVFDEDDSILNLINTVNPFSWIRAVKWVVSKNPDYVIIRYWHPYFALCLGVISRILIKKSIFVIAWVDNAYPHESMPFQNYLINFFVRSCDAFMVMSESVKNQLIDSAKVHPHKIRVSPHPIYNNFGTIIEKQNAQKNIGIPDTSIHGKDKYILFFGLIRSYKGLDLLLEVMALEKIRKMGIKLIVAGEFYHSKNHYLDKINLLDVNDSVIIHDQYISNKDVKNYFCAADIVVQPYLSASQSGVSMIAVNFNKPMLLTNVGGLSEYVNNGSDGYLVEPNTHSISIALQDYYNNNREASFSNKIKQKKSLYSWQNLADKFDDLYKELKYG